MAVLWKPGDDPRQAHAASPAKHRRFRRAFSFGAFFVSAFFCAVVVFFAVDGPVAILSRHLAPVEAFVEEKLDRRLTIGNVSGTVWPELALHLGGVAISGKHGQGEPLLLLPSIIVRIDAKEAARTLGQHIVIEEIVVDGGVLRAERDEFGEVDVLQILKLLPPIPPEVADNGLLRRFRVQRGRIEFHDAIDREGGGVSVTVSDVAAVLSDDAAAGRPADLHITGVWNEAGGAPLVLEGHVDEVPHNLRPVPVPKTELRLTVSDATLATGLESLGLPPVFHRGVADLVVDVDLDASGVYVDIAVDADDVVAFDRAIPKTEISEEAQLRLCFYVDTNDGHTVVDQLGFTGAGLFLAGSWTALQPLADGVEDLAIDIAIDDLQRLRRRIPVVRAVTPGALSLTGPASARFTADAAHVVVDADLAGAAVSFGEALRKNAGAPLSLFVDAQRPMNDDEDERVRGVIVARGPGVVVDGGFVVSTDVSVFDLRLERMPLLRLLALSPLLHELLDGDVHGGSVAAHVDVTVTDAGGSVGVHLGADDVDLVLPDKGNGRGDVDVDVDVAANASGLAIGAKVDLDDVAGNIVAKDGGRPWFVKRKGARLMVEMKLREARGPGTLVSALGSLQQTDAATDVVGATALAPRWRTIAQQLAGSGRLRAAHLTVAGTDLDDVDLALQLADGRFSVLDPSSLRVFSGVVAVSGSFVDVKGDPAVIVAKGRIKGVDVGRALAEWSDRVGRVSGVIDVDVDARATGLALTPWQQSLKGRVALSTHKLRVDKLRGLVDVGAVARDETVVFVLGGGGLRLQRPLAFATAAGPVSVDGGLSFAGGLDVDARLTLGKGALPLALHLGGTLTKPEPSLPTSRPSWSTSKSKAGAPTPQR